MTEKRGRYATPPSVIPPPPWFFASDTMSQVVDGRLAQGVAWHVDWNTPYRPGPEATAKPTLLCGLESRRLNRSVLILTESCPIHRGSVSEGLRSYTQGARLILDSLIRPAWQKKLDRRLRWGRYCWRILPRRRIRCPKPARRPPNGSSSGPCSTPGSASASSATSPRAC